MDKELLLKYISGKASRQENEEVAAWIDADAAHLEEFIALRKSYDAFVWQDTSNVYEDDSKTYSLRPALWKWLKVAAVFVLAFGLSFGLLQVLQKENVEMQTVYVPAGQRTRVTLADGTTVWVNGKSTLSFPNKFSSRMRRVELDGEAYFDVRKNPEKQFIVSTAHQSAIKVLGTKFNVKAHKEAHDVITTLMEGKVNFEFIDTLNRAQCIAMLPGQRLVYHSLDGSTELFATSGEREVAWKDNKIIFKKSSLREALDILADRYDVEFVIRKNVPSDDLFSGTFTDRSLEQILNFISLSSKIRWRYVNIHATSGKEKIEIYI